VTLPVANVDVPDQQRDDGGAEQRQRPARGDGGVILGTVGNVVVAVMIG
jgi:hypothetical protein